MEIFSGKSTSYMLHMLPFLFIYMFTVNCKPNKHQGTLSEGSLPGICFSIGISLKMRAVSLGVTSQTILDAQKKEIERSGWWQL